ncbi:ABC transporter permease/substrate-binding protein [Niallia circulans]|uniref:ABC transporter permease/substrate-binding protein n=1 Tax=Niallia circulans TaxID=1397 RepID=UPI00155FBEA8|nr:ABC transporter permease/substrate-binding protein [Niallia circulans]NRG33092.1 ABC transporter permease/substrate-binding protein [Niallia circulans]
MNNFINVLSNRKGQLLTALLEHIQISFIALFFALLISIPLGIYLTRKKRLAEIIIGITAVLQTIPSLALLGLLIPLVGIGTVPSIIALVIYALLPILRNVYTGIKEVDSSLLEAARGLGMNNRKLLLKVELPLAMPVIMAGIRTGMVLIIGTATLAALIGAGGLGELITVGIDRNDTNLIIIGAIPSAILALFFDFFLRKVEKLSPRKSLISIISIVVAAGLVIFLPMVLQEKKADITIGAKIGAEPEILINMYKLLIEEETDLSVELKPNLGATTFVYNALASGSIDIYPEFTGTAINEFLKQTAISTNAEDVYNQAREGMLRKFNLVMLKPMKYNNTYALAIPMGVAKEYNLNNISDLKTIEDKIIAGFTPEFPERDDGYLGIQNKYGIQFAEVNIMQPKLRYTAIDSGKINVVDAYSTDSEIEEYNLKVLEDNQHLFPPYQGPPMLREETIEKYPELKTILNKLSNKITDDEMRKMNYEVNVNDKEPNVVAKEYLVENNLLK